MKTSASSLTRISRKRCSALRRLDRRRKGRKALVNGTRLRSPVQHDHVERPADAGCRNTARGDAITGGVGGITCLKLSPIRPRKGQWRSRCTRPVARTSHGGSVLRSHPHARPLDNDGMVLNLGVKAINDTPIASGRLHSEFSGIFGFANDDSPWFSACRRVRAARQWFLQLDGQRLAIQPWDGRPAGTLNAAQPSRRPLYVQQTNTPGVPADDLLRPPITTRGERPFVCIPNDIRYAFSDAERTRTNVQATVHTLRSRR